MQNRPVILLITGAWHVPEHYLKVSDRLRHLGYTVECPHLMTNNNALPPNKTIDDDVVQIRELAKQYLDLGKDIVALMHSYGGIVGTTALSGLGAADRNGQSYVKALIYMCAFLPFEGESLAGIFGGGLPPFLTPNTEGTLDITDPGFHFYDDIPTNEQAKWVAKLVRHPTIAQFEAPKSELAAAWRKIPVTYLFCAGDKGLIMPLQEMMVKRIQDAEADLVVDQQHCNASHSPFLSMPDKVVDVVKLVCGETS